MSAPPVEIGTHKELAPATAPSAATAPAVPQASAPLQAKVAHPPVAVAPASAVALQRVQNATSRALAEVSYGVRRLGAAATVGIAAVVVAASLFLANNLPQSASLAALKAQLLRLAPVGKGAAAAPAGVSLASLPPRSEAPNLVAKILEEANASGVGLPRGQYEYVSARDGVAARYRMTFPLRASYPKIREFMDRTLLALPAVAVEGLRIERKNVGDDTVDAELKLSAYVRSEE